MTLNNFMEISLGAIIGVMLRMEISEIIEKYFQLSNQIPKDSVSNFLGSFIIGYYNDIYLQQNYSLHLRITVGLCGSLTTFSSWIIGGIKLLSSGKISSCIIYLFLGITVIYSGFKIGQTFNQQLIFILNDKIFKIVIIKFLIFALIFQQWHILLAGLIAPIGAYCRFLLSIFNRSTFPFGTFITNFISVCFVSFLSSEQLISQNPLFTNTIIKGFCGSLSTVSTWIKELCNQQNIEQSLIYFWLSISLNLYIGSLIYVNLL